MHQSNGTIWHNAQHCIIVYTNNIFNELLKIYMSKIHIQSKHYTIGIIGATH